MRCLRLYHWISRLRKYKLCKRLKATHHSIHSGACTSKIHVIVKDIKERPEDVNSSEQRCTHAYKHTTQTTITTRYLLIDPCPCRQYSNRRIHPCQGPGCHLRSAPRWSELHAHAYINWDKNKYFHMFRKSAAKYNCTTEHCRGNGCAWLHRARTSVKRPIFIPDLLTRTIRKQKRKEK